ncbi:MAG: hypothetical protein M1838_003822 [Thelocarpon superellum]|nr:MAG: hypothetical protein M1838_003822 [Thelocarpon superellum]
MSTSHTSLAAQANERTARLAALKNLKRKQPPSDEPTRGASNTGDEDSSKTSTATPAPPSRSEKNGDADEEPDVTRLHLSGRNYDPEVRGPKLGFDAAPTAGESTVEVRAAALKEETARLQAKHDAEAKKPLDLWRLQPKRPNWDLKRDLEAKLVRVNVRTDNAIAKMVRKRVVEQQQRARKESGEDTDGEAAGLEGAALVEGVHMREREEDEERRADEADDLGTAT